MLSLVRSAGTSTRNHLIRSRIQVIRPTARYVSDTGLGGFGALSVPIPPKSNNEIRLGQTTKSKPKHKAEDGLKYTPPSNGSTTGGKGRRRREHLARLAAKAKDHEKSEKAKGDAAERKIKSSQVQWNEEKKAKTTTVKRGRKADTRVRRAGKAKPITHHTYGMSKEPKGSSGAGSVGSAEEGLTTGERIKETDFAPEEIEEIVNQPEQEEAPPTPANQIDKGRIQAGQVKIEEVTPKREMKVAKLAHGLHRVLFSPGVHPHRDLRSGVWNFPSEFSAIPTPEEYAFDRSPKYITPSQDKELVSLAKREKCNFIGSTSTLTGAFSHIYFAISGGKGVDLSSFSRSFMSERSDFTGGAEIPACLVLGPLGDGRYYVDSDKSYDTENVLSEYGVILEKLLVTDTLNFKRFLNSSPPESVTEAERNGKEAYRYSKYGNLMMRSQLDCQDDRLPGSGVFDIKTRACLPIRHDRANYLENNQYSILKDKGAKLSFEKEYYDIVRAGMLKWSMQARIGGMDGIFVAYHNCKRLFGFQYLPMAEIDERIFGSTEMGTQAFNLVVSLFEILVQHCADAFPGKEVSIVIRKNPTPESSNVIAYVTPTSPDGEKQPMVAYTMSFTSFINGRKIRRLLDNDTTDPQEWSVEYTITKSTSSDSIKSGYKKAIRDIKGISSVSVPTGKTIEEMSIISPSIKWKEPDRRIKELREEAKSSGGVYEKMKRGWKEAAAWWKP